MSDQTPPSRPVLHRPAKAKPADAPEPPAAAGGMRSKGYRSHGAAPAARPPAQRSNVWRSDDPSRLKGEGKPALRSAGIKRHDMDVPTDGQGRSKPRQLDRAPQRRRPEREDGERRPWREDAERAPGSGRRDDADARASQRYRQERPPQAERGGFGCPASRKTFRKNSGAVMNGRLGNIAAFCRGMSGLVRSRIAPTRAVGQGAATGRDSSTAPEGAGAWDRPVGEIIARRAIRTRNRDADAAARFERVHTILIRGRQ